MIIDKEQIDSVDSNGNPVKLLVISYVNKEGKISFLQWQIPQYEMYEWGYTNRANAEKPTLAYDVDTHQPILDENGQPKLVQWKSYDNKFIKKIPTTKNLSDSRINEIINSWGKLADPLFEANTPITWSCDIETAPGPDGFSEPEDAYQPINTIAITRFPQTIVFGWKPLTDKEQAEVQDKITNYSDLTKNYKFEYRYFTTEREMLIAFLQFIKDIPNITGWNFLGYDWTYIYNRCKLLGIDVLVLCPTRTFSRFKLNRKNVIDVDVPTHRIISDYMLIYRQWDRTVEVKENDTLDFVSNAVLSGVKKVEHEWDFEEFYNNHFVDYVFYNSVDTILVEKIDEKIKTAQIWYMLAAELRTSLNDAYSTIRPAETVMTNFLYPQYKVIPRHGKQEIAENGDYKGAFVWPTQPGVYKYIGGLDFASLYPSIMRQFQISPESFMFKDPTYVPKEDEIKCRSGAVYKKRKDALLPAILTVYFGKRKAAKKDRKTSDTDREFLIKKYEERFGKYEHSH